jgi:hypothetical protein
MAQAEPFKKYIKREIAPGAHITSDEDLCEYGRKHLKRWINNRHAIGLDIPHLCSATWVVDGIVDLPTDAKDGAPYGPGRALQKVYQA